MIAFKEIFIISTFRFEWNVTSIKVKYMKAIKL